MANTFTFTTVTGGSTKYKANSGPSHIIEENDWLDQLGGNIIRITSHNGGPDIDVSVDTVITVVGGVTTTYGPGSNVDTVYDALNPLFKKGNTSSAGSGLLPVDSRIVYVGNSLTAHGFGTNNGTSYYYGDGFATPANIRSGNIFYNPPGSNKGVAGDRTDQVIARLGAIKALRPKVAVVEIGINDVVQNVSSATIIANIDIIYKTLKSIGCKIVALTIHQVYTPFTALTTAQNNVRIAVNSWIQANTDISGVVVTEPLLNSSSLFVDGIHPNTQGDDLLGTAIATILKTLGTSQNTGYQVDPESVQNYLLAGGTTTATNWSSSLFAGGATAAFSKTTDNNANQQLITISGNYTGNGMGLNFKQDFTTSYYAAGDIVEGIIDIEITSPFVNINGVAPVIYIYTAGFASLIGSGFGYYPTSTADWYMPVGRYTIKTPAFVIGAGTPAIVTTQCTVFFKDAATSTAISGAFKIHHIGSRKIPSAL